MMRSMQRSTARSAGVIVWAAGVAVSAASASGQTAFMWNVMGDGLWTDDTAWSPMGSPGDMSALDTATVGLAGPLLVEFNASRSISGLSITNPDARVRINPNLTMTLQGNYTGAGTLVLNTGASGFNSLLRPANGVVLDGVVELDGPAPNDAQLIGPTMPGEIAIVGPNGTVFGNGRLDGRIRFEGLLRVDAGDTIELILDDGLITGGGTINENGGNFVYNGHTLSDITVLGDLRLDGGETVTILDGVSVTNVAHLNNGMSGFNSIVNLGNGVTTDIDFILDGPATEDAQIFGPTLAGERATLGAGSTVTGNGRLDGFLDFAGQVTAENDDVIFFRLDDGQVTGGGTFTELDGDFAWNGHRLTDVTIAGAPRVDLGETIFIGPDVTFTAPLTLNNGVSGFNAVLEIENGITFGTQIELNGATPDDARINGPRGAMERATLGSSSLLSGQGTLDGLLDFAGTVNIDDMQTIVFSIDDGIITGGGNINETDGDAVWNGHTLTNIRLSGAPRVDLGETLNIGQGVTFFAPITLNNGLSGFNAVLNVLDGVTLFADVVLNGATTDDARLVGPRGDGEVGTLGSTSTVVGQGTLDGLLSIEGDVTAPVDQSIAFRLDDSIITGGGTLREDGDFAWNNHIATNITIEGTPKVDFGENLFFGPGVTLADPITLNNGMSGFNAILTLNDGVSQDGSIVLNGAANEDAQLNGPNADGESAALGTGSLLTGRGRIRFRLDTLAGTISPGMGFGTDTIEFRQNVPVSFTDTTTLEIGFAGVAPGEFDQIHSNVDLTLDGTLRVEALGGFEPLSTNEIEIISGAGTVTGTFDTVEYTGNLEEGDVARVFYEPSRVVFAVTCASDTTLPAGILDIFDILVFLDVWNAMDDGADFNEDGSINIFDILDFLAAWNAGCPE